MDKKELSGIRKVLKVDNDYKLRVGYIYNLYGKKDSKEIIFADKRAFGNLEEKEQELFLTNFKKMITGAIGTKLFELEFEAGDEGKKQQKLLCDILNKEDDFEEVAKELAGKILEEYVCDTDILISFMKAEYIMPTNKKKKNEDEGEDDTAVAFSFIMCSINRIEQPKKTLQFDFDDKEFKVGSSLDLIINLNKPLDGFMFPTITEGYADINKVLYCTSKANQINEFFSNAVLSCKTIFTAKQEKEMFCKILKSAVGEKIKPELIHSVYEEIVEEKEDNEEGTISASSIERILDSKGIETESIKNTITEITGDNTFDFKIDNIVPSSGKSIKINSSDANISLTPEALKNVKQVKNKSGRKCILIEIDESVSLEGFELEVEKL